MHKEEKTRSFITILLGVLLVVVLLGTIWFFGIQKLNQGGENTQQDDGSLLSRIFSPKGVNLYQKVTGEDAEEDQKGWDALFETTDYVFGKEPSEFLKKHVSVLKKGGRVLDLAMSEGRNAVFLAKYGFKVEGVDFSEVALRKAKLLARERNVSIKTIKADLNLYKIEPAAYDVILSIHYLQRSLIPQMKKGLKPGGIVVFENYTMEQLNNDDGRSLRRDYLLEKGELKSLFSDLDIMVYSETNNGKEALAQIIARRSK